eukprot:4023145-Pyramimonas_sp.AAC.1
MPSHLSEVLGGTPRTAMACWRPAEELAVCKNENLPLAPSRALATSRPKKDSIIQNSVRVARGRICRTRTSVDMTRKARATTSRGPSHQAASHHIRT